MSVPVRRRARLGATAALALALGGACGRHDASSRTDEGASTSAVSAPASAAGTPATGAPTTPAASAAPSGSLDALEGDSANCVHDGRWRQCSVADRLRRAGLVPHRQPEPARAPFLHTPGVRYTLGSAELQAFVYPDTAALARDLAALDTVLVAPRGQRYDWPAHPTFIHSGNLLGIYLGLNERAIERVQLALEAGPPQPEPPK